jgi:hypothetical protein
VTQWRSTANAYSRPQEKVGRSRLLAAGHEKRDKVLLSLLPEPMPASCVGTACCENLMPAKRTRTRAHVPLSDEDLAHGKTYYSAEEIEAILKVLKPGAGFDQSAFVRKLEGLASWGSGDKCDYLLSRYEPSTNEDCWSGSSESRHGPRSAPPHRRSSQEGRRGGTGDRRFRGPGLCRRQSNATNFG